MIVDIPLTEEIHSLTMTPFSELRKIKSEQVELIKMANYWDKEYAAQGLIAE